MISEDDVWRIGASPFVVRKAQVGFNDEIGSVALDVQRQGVEIGTPEPLSIFTFPGQRPARFRHLEADGVLLYGSTLPRFDSTAIGLRTFDDDFLTIVQQDFLFPAIAAEPKQSRPSIQAKQGNQYKQREALQYPMFIITRKKGQRYF